MKKQRFFIPVTLMVMMILTMAGCGGEGSGVIGAQGGSTTASAAAPVGAATNGDKLVSAKIVAGTVKMPKTGQTHRYAPDDDGTLLEGVAWPDQRFTDNGNGAVTDNLTGLVWLKNANCFGPQSWAAALGSANTLASGACGLSDGSTAGQWRLPNIVELESLVDLSQYDPALPAGHPFSGVRTYYGSPNFYNYAYWTSTFVGMYNTTGMVGVISLCNGEIQQTRVSTATYVWSSYVWPVRDKAP